MNPELCTYLIIGKETGEDGTPHLQGYVRLRTKVRLSTMKQYLPRAHLEPAKGNDWQNKVYCSKDGDFQEWGIIPKAPKEKDSTYAEALSANTVAEGLAVVKEKRPRDYCLHGETIERNLKRHKCQPYKSKYKLSDFNKSPLCLSKATLLCGTTNCGKTQFAKAHFKNALFIRHIDKLKTFNPDHDGIIFDDMSFKQWPPEAVIHLLDTEEDSEIHVRYGTANIPSNTVKVFTHQSENPFYDLEKATQDQQDAIERRLDRVIILNKLY